MQGDKPLVSVYMTTYFHEKYVAQAIESVLNQKTDFPIQIVISDDASEDKTQDILLDYASKYQFIKLNLNEKNIGLTANMYKVKSLCDGKYICDLSGDDYWIDDNKLSKQVAFLEENEDYFAVCCCSEARADNETKAMRIYPDKKYLNKDFTLKMFLRGKNFPMNGIMMRNPVNNPDLMRHFAIMPEMSPYIDDLTDNLLILLIGKAYILPDHMVAYRIRRSTKGDHNYNSLNSALSSFQKYVQLLNNLDSRFNDIDFFYRYKEEVFNSYFCALRSRSVKGFRAIYKEIPIHYRRRFLFLRSLSKLPYRLLMKMYYRIKY